MGQSYSLDLRARIVGHVRAGHSRRDAARHFRVSASCAVKLLKRADRTGSVEPAHRGRPRGSGKLAAHQAFLIGRVEAQPDITMPELAAALAAERGVIASPASLSRVLCKAGFTDQKTADGLGVRTRRRAGATTGVDREASAPHAASAGTSGVHRRDRGQHQDDAAAWAQPSRTALARLGAVRPLGHPDLHRCAPV
jgi:transposase